MTILSSFSDIICVEEHFLLDSRDKKHSNTNLLKTHFGSSYDMFINPAFKENNQVCKGRGKGGLATIWRAELSKYVSQVKCKNFRLQGTKFSFPNQNLLVINCYFPCDPRSDNGDYTELLNTLSNLSMLVEQGPHTFSL